MNNLSAASGARNHDVDTLLTLDECQTPRDAFNGFCLCLRIILLLRARLGIRVARLACPTEVGEFVPLRLAFISKTCSDLDFRAYATGFLGLVRSRRRRVSYQFRGDDMSEPKKDAPRRYIMDGAGQRVLVGLTISETIEFEALESGDARPGTDLLANESGTRQHKHNERWLELYVKHERAWSHWMAETRTRLTPHLLN